MSSETQHVIIAYFDSLGSASDAGVKLKDWDKAIDAIKLGGIGILHWENGEIKSKKVGARKTGAGAAWGAALGVGLALLTGGASLIGGAVVGVAGGAVVGALFHKGLGLTDADKARLEEHLKSGGAALVVMANYEDVTMTSDELARLGGKVENYQVPAEHAESFQAAVNAESANV